MFPFAFLILIVLLILLFINPIYRFLNMSSDGIRGKLKHDYDNRTYMGQLTNGETIVFRSGDKMDLLMTWGSNVNAMAAIVGHVGVYMEDHYEMFPWQDVDGVERVLSLTTIDADSPVTILYDKTYEEL